MSGADEGIGSIVLEYTTNGGMTYVLVDTMTGTDADPLLGTEAIKYAKNESGKDQVYRWRCTAYSGNAGIPCYLSNHIQTNVVMMLTASLAVLADSEAPASGVDGDGAGFAGTGSVYIDTSDGKIYSNVGTSSMTSWSSL